MGYIRIEAEAGGRSDSETRGHICPHAEGGRERLNRLCRELKTASGEELQLLAVVGDDEAAEGFVVFGTAVGEGSMPFVEPFVMLDGITEIGVG